MRGLAATGVWLRATETEETFIPRGSGRTTSLLPVSGWLRGTVVLYTLWRIKTLQ